MLIVSDTAPGTSERSWLEGGHLHALPSFAWEAGAPLVVVAPHPDDEVLGAAGLLRVAARSGSAIVIVAVTDGEASHPGTRWCGERLAARRRAESAEALDRLAIGPVDVVRCSLPDGAVADHEDRLAGMLRDLLGPASCCAATWRFDGHPDHDATGRAAARAATATGATLLEHPIWAWHWATPDGGLPLGRARRLDLSIADHRAKGRAIAAFTSQIEPLGTRPEERAVLPPAVRARFERRFEVHLCESPT